MFNSTRSEADRKPGKQWKELEQAIKAARIPPADKLALTEILGKCINWETCTTSRYLTLEKLAELVGVSRRSIRDVIERLKEHGWVKVRKEGRRNTYMVFIGKSYTLGYTPGSSPMTDAERSRRYRAKKQANLRDGITANPRDEHGKSCVTITASVRDDFPAQGMFNVEDITGEKVEVEVTDITGECYTCGKVDELILLPRERGVAVIGKPYLSEMRLCSVCAEKKYAWEKKYVWEHSRLGVR